MISVSVQRLMLASAGMLAMVSAGAVQAQKLDAAAGPSPSGDASESDILVTAQKRPEHLGDVPMSVSVASGDQLARRGLTRPDELEAMVPGFTFQASPLGTPVYAIRGVGFYDTSIGGSPAVSIYLDQMPLPYSVEARGIMLDLDRLEVLKGPQGTLFGQNTTGGALNFIAAKPTDRFGAGLDVSYGRFSATRVQGFVSGPLAHGLNLRISARHEYRDDWQKAFPRNDARFGQDDEAELGARHFTTARALLDWTPSERLKIAFNLNGWRDRSDTVAARFIAFAPIQIRSANNAATYAALPMLVEPPREARIAGWQPGQDFARNDYFAQLGMRADWTLSNTMTLTSISAASRYKERSVFDSDGTAYADFLGHRAGKIASLSEELRVSGESAAWHWLLGAEYAHDRTQEFQNNMIGGGTSNGIGRTRVDSIGQRNRQQVDSYAAFAGADLAIAKAVMLRGSIRYTRQDRSYTGCTSDSGDGTLARAINALFRFNAGPGDCISQTSPGTLPPFLTGELNEDNVSFRTSIDWKLRRDALVYISMAKGYKPGSFAIVPAVFATQLDPVGQESVMAYEAGAKTALLNGRLQIRAAAYYYDYVGKQLLGSAVLPPLGALPKLVSIPKSRVLGGEIETIVRPSKAFSLMISGAYTGSKVLQDPANPLDAFGRPKSFIGQAFPNTPHWQATGGAEYVHPVGSTTRLVLDANLTARSGSYSAFGENPALKLKGYMLLNARIALEASDGSWRFQLWGRNITDQFYYVGLGHHADVVSGFTGMPATYGFTLERRWGHSAK